MPVYDQEQEKIGNQYDDDYMRRATGINQADEKAIDARAANSSGLSPEQINKAEHAANNPNSASVSQAEDGRFGSAGGGGQFGEDSRSRLEKLGDDATDGIGQGFTYKNSQGKRRFRLSRAQGGGVVAGLLGSGLLGIFGLLSGPLQLIHISQLLTGFHLSPMENFTDDRNSRLGRYIRHISRGSGVENVRMGQLGNNIANKIEAKMNQSGLQSAYGERFGFQEGFRIDPNSLADDSSLRELNLDDQDSVKRQVAERYGVSPDKIRVQNGIVEVGFPGSELSSRELRGMQRTVLREAGYSKIGGALRKRIMFRRGGVSLHPLKRLDRKLITTAEARIQQYKEDRRERIKNGADPPGAPVRGQVGEVDEDGNVIREDTQDEASKAQQDLQPEGDTPEAKKASLRAKLAGGGAGIAAAAGVLCALGALNEQVDEIRFQNVSLPLIRLGGEAIAIGSQLMTGQDVDFEQVNYLLGQLYDPETQQSWVGAKSMQAEMGQPLTGEDVGEEISFKEGRHPIQQAIGLLPDLGPICTVVENTFFQIIATAGSLIGGPITGSVAFVVGELVNRFVISGLLDNLVNFLAGEEVDTDDARGAKYGNFINYGARLAANDAAISGGGIPLTPAQVAELEAENEIIKEQETQYASVYDRYFNLYKHDSMASSFLMSPQIMYGNGLVSMVQNPINSFSNVGSLLGNVFTPGAFAQPTSEDLPQVREGDYSYGFDEYGFPASDRDHPDVANPYENGDVVYEFLQSNSDDINEKAEECFGITLTDKADYEVIGPVNIQAIETNCLEPPSGLDEDDWRRVRVYIHDIQTITGMACYEGDEAACTKLGFNTENSQTTQTASGLIVGDPNEPSAEVACAPGTRDLGTSIPAWNRGNQIESRLCAIEGWMDEGGSSGLVPGSNREVVVTSRVSGAWRGLWEAAKADGVNLRATSSFRSFERQTELCGPSGRHGCARPGYSNHQTGHAIDMLGIGGGIAPRGSTCTNGRKTRPNNPDWVWLEENAARFGFGQLAIEAWHWDADPRSCR